MKPAPEEVKKKFRNQIKQATLEHLEGCLKKAQSKLWNNRLQIKMLANEQKTLKAETAELNRMVQEYKK